MAWWIPLALAAGSMYANNRAQKKVDDETKDAYRSNQNANAIEEERALAAANASRDEYANFDQRQQSAQDSLGSEFIAAQKFAADAGEANQIATEETGGGDTSRIVEANTQRNEGSKRYTSELAQALGNLRGTSQGFFDSSLAGADNLVDIRQAQGNMRGNNRVLTGDLQDARQAGKGWGTAGDALSLAAMVTAPMALAAAPASANAAGAGMSIGGGSTSPLLGTALNPASPGGWATRFPVGSSSKIVMPII